MLYTKEQVYARLTKDMAEKCQEVLANPMTPRLIIRPKAALHFARNEQARERFCAAVQEMLDLCTAEDFDHLMEETDYVATRHYENLLMRIITVMFYRDVGEEFYDLLHSLQ